MSLDTYDLLIQADGASHLWQMPTSGTTVTDLIGASNGLTHNTPTLNVTSLLKASAKPAIGFTAASQQYISVAGLNVPTGAITLETWLETALLSDTGIIGQYNTTTGALLYGQNSDQVALFINANSIQYDTNGGIQDGKPHYVCATWDGSNGRIYYDGALVVGPTAMAGPISAAGKPFSIAQYGTPFGTYWTGETDRPALYPIALSGAQVSAHYALGIATSWGAAGRGRGRDLSMPIIDPSAHDDELALLILEAT